MSALSHQSFANTDTPYWASAVEPTTLISPTTIRDKQATKKVVITANANGTGGVFYANDNGTNPFGMGFAQGITQPGNQLIFDVGNVLPAMNVTSSNVVSSLPIVIDSPLNPQNFQIIPTPGGVSIQQGVLGSGGSAIDMTNSPTGSVTIMAASSFTGTGLAVADKVGGETLVESTQILCTSGNGANIAKFGVSGTAAYMGNGNSVPNISTPGVIVNDANGCELQFRDASLNLFGMKSTAGNLVVSTPSVSAAISVSPSGQVTIPDIISGSFVPIGGIVMFSGSPLTLPANWKVCDGVFPGTPDLTSKFIIGASPTYPAGTSGGSTTITTSNLPAHNHGVNDPGHSHDVVLTAMFNNGDNGSAIVYAGQSLTGTAGNRQSDPNAAQTRVTGITTQNTGSGAAYLPPYYALAYIIRIA